VSLKEKLEDFYFINESAIKSVATVLAWLLLLVIVLYLLFNQSSDAFQYAPSALAIKKLEANSDLTGCVLQPRLTQDAFTLLCNAPNNDYSIVSCVVAKNKTICSAYNAHDISALNATRATASQPVNPMLVI
jgi:hypothetical protein